MANVPPLKYSENTVKNITYFVKIDLGAQAQPEPTTGIFIPEKYKVGSEVDMILWLMGHHDNPTYPPSLAIDDYWFKYPHFHFRQFVNASNKNVILVAPSLGPSSQSGTLTTRGGLSWYLDQILAALNAHGPFSTIPTLGNLVIACHSGGGAPMRVIANTAQTYSDNIKQLWGFDCLYSDSDVPAWISWAKGNGFKKLFIRYGNGGTAERSETLRKSAADLGNINVDGSVSTEHNKVPATYWGKFLRGAHIFDNISGD